MYKLNSTGKSIQVWEIHLADDYTSYTTVSGQVDGKMTTSAPTVIIPKAGRTQKQQAMLEADGKSNLKRRGKYVNNIKHVGKKAEKDLPGYSAMLAKKWEDQKDKIVFPCAVQPKLDGIRCLATKDGLFTRSRKVIEACQHIHVALKPFFKKHPHVKLDGELYSHELKNDFEKIIKAVRKSAAKATPEDLEVQKQVKYHVYDAPVISKLTEEDSFLHRMTTLWATGVGAIEGVVLVHTDIHIRHEDDLMSRHNKYLGEGYEGTMVRNLGMVYKGSRSSELLKLKEFDDDEFEIIKVEEGRGGLVGHAATFTLKMKTGSTFRAKLEGSFERLKYIWKHPDVAMGKMCTVRYQGLTNKEGVPRFPVAKTIRGLKDKSDWL